MAKARPASVSFSPDPARVRKFLHEWPAYAPSPLVSAAAPGAEVLFIKNETGRLGLGSFKALGGPFAVARLLEDRWTEARGTSLPQDPRDPMRVALARELTFVCASAGNHGMAVAAGARHVGARARIHLSHGVQQVFADRLTGQGAEVVRSGATYEESLVAAERDARDSQAILLSDTSGAEPHRPASLVMEGYTVMAEELREQFSQGGRWPTHVFVQAGVGGIAGALAYMIRKNWPAQPRIIVVEPDAAPCLAQSHRAGRPVTVEGPVSNMGRLDCKEPSHVAFEVLKAANVEYIAVGDAAALRAARDLEEIYGIATTPSGAAGFAGLRELMQTENVPRPLIVVTEGAVT